MSQIDSFSNTAAEFLDGHLGGVSAEGSAVVQNATLKTHTCPHIDLGIWSFQFTVAAAGSLQQAADGPARSRKLGQPRELLGILMRYFILPPAASL